MYDILASNRNCPMQIAKRQKLRYSGAATSTAPNFKNLYILKKKATFIIIIITLIRN